MSDGLTLEDRQVRVAVYNLFAEKGHAPRLGDLLIQLDLPEDRVRESLGRLDAHHALLLQPDGESVMMAWPFSGVETPFGVRHADGRHWYANCAWDMLGIPAMLGMDALLDGRCAQSGAPMRMAVRDGQPSEFWGVVHFLLPFRQWYQDVEYT
jgi:hypothetical protein